MVSLKTKKKCVKNWKTQLFFEQNYGFRNFAVETKNQKDALEHRQQVFQQYRQTQLLVNLANYCFQSHFWPTIEFIGGVVLITLSYVFLLFHSLFPLWGIFCLCSFDLAGLIILCAMLHMGSNLRLISMRILKPSKRWYQCKITRKYFRSCNVVQLCVGGFHKMDRGRCPSFVRFVVQRTFLLVFKTKLSTKNCSKIIVRI